MLRYKYLLTGLTVLLLILFFYYGQIVSGVGQTAFSAGGDGYKNYYTLAYYVNYNSGTHFTGMNYPYGENVIYTDNQPLLAWCLKGLSGVFPGIKTHIRLIIISLLLASIVVAYVMLYFILYDLKLPGAYAAFVALPIALMSPQIARINGHYSLGYTFFFPVFIFLTNRFLQYANRQYLVALTLLLSAFIFIHPYYFAISALFTVCIVIATVVISRKKITALKLLIPVTITFVLFKSYLLFTDNVADRTSIPWGFVMSRSTIADILLQPNGFVYRVLCGLIDCSKIVFHFEGQAYIGVTALLCLPLVVLSYCIQRLKSLQLPLTMLIMLAASLPVLLFGMAFPFSVNATTETWLEYMPSSLLQFRASGRFSWVFYYTACLASAFVLHQTTRLLQSKGTRMALFLGMALVWGYDTHLTNRYWIKGINNSKNHINEQAEASNVTKKLAEQNLTIDSFQAILPMPYFNNGSEKLYITSPMEFKGMKLSYGTGLPLAATMMSRTSISQTFNLVNIFSSPLIHKNILADLPSGKPFLVMCSGTTNAFELALLAKAKYLFTDGDISYHSLNVSKLYDDRVFVKHYAPQMQTYKHSNYSSTDSLPNVYVNSFEGHTHQNALAGKSSFYQSTCSNTVIFYGQLPNAAASSSYEISAWFYTDERVVGYPVLNYQVYNDNGNLYADSIVDGKYAREIYNNWVKVTSVFTLHHTTDRVKVMVNGTHVTMDELMIKPLATTVLTHLNQGQTFGYNNYPLPND